jgi:dTDP-4-amino-4,6-dideoxygalactose transaminase
MKVPFFSFEGAPEELKLEWMQVINDTVYSGVFIGGSKLKEFELAWAKFLQAKFAIGVGNGYDALKLALMALEVGPGHLVAVPSHTFIATWLAVDSVGATPIGVDVNEFGQLDVEFLEKSELDFKLVIPVHMHGRTVDMYRLMEWAKRTNTLVVEDCAQAHGASIKGQLVGTFGAIGCYSFYPTKNLGALGDAGALITNDAELARRIRQLSNYGAELGQKYNHVSIGVNSRLDNIQAAILNVNLKHLNKWNKRRAEIASQYLHSNKSLALQPQFADKEQVFHHFTILVKNRNETMAFLNMNGVGTEIHYPRLASEEYEEIKGKEKSLFKNADFISQHILSIPLHPWISEKESIYISDLLARLDKRNAFL